MSNIFLAHRGRTRELTQHQWVAWVAALSAAERGRLEAGTIVSLGRLAFWKRY